MGEIVSSAYRNLLERIRNLICLEERSEKSFEEALAAITCEGCREKHPFMGRDNDRYEEGVLYHVDSRYSTYSHCRSKANEILVAIATYMPLHSMLKDYFTQAGLDWREILPKEEKVASQEGLREALVARMENLDAYYSEVHEGKTLLYYNDVVKAIDAALSTPPSAKTAPPARGKHHDLGEPGKEWREAILYHLKDYPNLGDCEWNCLTMESFKEVIERIVAVTKEAKP